MSLNYNFESLSPLDFENLCRDLLQKEYRIHLESFATGRDDGIDFRYSQDTNYSLIVQCKHYASGFNKLLSNLKREELSKISQLSPQRYILATSTSLTPNQKQQILDLLKPYCLSTSDIFSKEDLNNLLGKHPQIERQHIKLWLQSATVLAEILNGRITNLTRIKLSEIVEKSKIFVKGRAFQRAYQVLEHENYCIISGIPGIGKSTLAQMLLMDLMRQGFDVYSISNSILDASSLLVPGKKIAFYYDDFLGETRLQLAKNEASDLLAFIAEVTRNPDVRLILTTREYILEEAKIYSEKLQYSKFDLARCTVNLSDYTDLDKGQILYNHLYFSDLPESHKRKVLENNFYEDIVAHPNFNPRIIEYVTKYAQRVSGGTLAKDYPKVFLDSLNNPKDLWNHAFSSLADDKKIVLIALASLPSPIDARQLREACNSLILTKAFAQSHIKYLSAEAFGSALSYLNGTFVNVEVVPLAELFTDQTLLFHHRPKNLTIVQFQNPSIRDFLENYYNNNEELLLAVIESACYFEQCENLWTKNKQTRNILVEHRMQLLTENADKYVKILRHCYNKESVKIGLTFFGFELQTYSTLNRLTFVISVTSAINSKEAHHLAADKLIEVKKHIETGKKFRKQELLNLLDELKAYLHFQFANEHRNEEMKLLIDVSNKLIVGSRDLFTVNSWSTIEDYELLAQYLKITHGNISYYQLANIQSLFVEFIKKNFQEERLNLHRIHEISNIAHSFNIDLEVEIPEMIQYLDLDSKKQQSAITQIEASTSQAPKNHIQSMFQSFIQHEAI